MQKLLSHPLSSNLFFGTSGPTSARVLIVGEAWGETEAREQRPFTGASGAEFNKMLFEAGLEPDYITRKKISPYLPAWQYRTQCLCTNVCSEHPPNNDFTYFLLPTPRKKVEKDVLNHRGLYPTPRFHKHLSRLYALVAHVQPTLIIATGNLPFWALTDHASCETKQGFKLPTGILTWRGSQCYSIPIEGKQFPVLPIIHPAAVLREWGFRHITVHDLRSRAKRFLNSNLQWEPPKLRSHWEPDFTTTMCLLNSWIAICHRTELQLAVDLETYKRKYISVVGLADDTQELAIPLFYFGARGGRGAIESHTEPRDGRRARVCLSGEGTTGMEKEAPVARTYEEQRAPYLPPVLPATHKSIYNAYWTVSEEQEIWSRLRTLLEHPNCKIIGQNFTYDTQWFFRYYNINAIIADDTLIAQHLLFPGLPKSLPYIASLYCHYYCYWKDESEDWDSSTIGAEQLWQYNCKDLRATYEAMQLLRILIHSRKVNSNYQFLLDSWNLARTMTLRGTNYDLEEKSSMLNELRVQIASREQWLEACIPLQLRKLASGKPYFTSPIAMRDLLYTRLGLRLQLHKKTKKPTTDDTALAELSDLYPQFALWLDTLSEWRSMCKFEEFLLAKEGVTGRLHPQFNIAQPETFRWSSSENSFGEATNCQNVPKVDD